MGLAGVDRNVTHQVSVRAHPRDRRGARPGPRQGADDLPALGQRRPGRAADDPRRSRPTRCARATGCCAWASAPACTPRWPRSSGDRGAAPARGRPRGRPGRSRPSRSTAAVDRPGRAHRGTCSTTARPCHAAEPVGTLLCVHGNPTWSFLWRRAGRGRRARAARRGGWSPSTSWRWGSPSAPGSQHRLADRVADLGRLTDELGLAGPGRHGRARLGRPRLPRLGARPPGPARRRRAHQHRRAPRPATPLPAALRVATAPGVLPVGTVTTPAFLATRSPSRTPAWTRPSPTPSGAVPDRRPARGHRRLRRGHPRRRPTTRAGRRWTAIAAGVRGLDVPALLLWGPRDPVFSARYLRDLRGPAAARGRAPLRGRRAPGRRGRGRRRPRCCAGWTPRRPRSPRRASGRRAATRGALRSAARRSTSAADDDVPALVDWPPAPTAGRGADLGRARRRTSTSWPAAWRRSASGRATGSPARAAGHRT